MLLGQLAAHRPVRHCAAAVEQARAREHERTGADRRDALHSWRPATHPGRQVGEILRLLRMGCRQARAPDAGAARYEHGADVAPEFAGKRTRHQLHAAGALHWASLQRVDGGLVHGLAANEHELLVRAREHLQRAADVQQLESIEDEEPDWMHGCHCA